MNSGSVTITVATLNLRNTADRWPERERLVIDQLLALHPDVIGLQEVRRTARQGLAIARALNARLERGSAPYTLVMRHKTGLRRFWEGIAVLSRLPVLDDEWLDLRGGSRVAQRAALALPGGEVLHFYNTHLPHAARAELLRAEQVGRLLGWMEEWAGQPQVLVGDFNAGPRSPEIGVLRPRLRSAYAVVHGAEPERTFPTPLRPTVARPAVLDFIFVNDLVGVHDARLAFDQPSAEDGGLMASDHYGLAARISILGSAGSS